MTNTTRRMLPLALALLTLSGCDQQSASSRALEDAANAMQALTAESVIVDPETDRRVYRQVLSLVTVAQREGTIEEKAVAALLTARCNAGLAKDPAGLAQELETRASSITSNITALHELWLRSNAGADAAAGYDPSDDIARIREQIAEKDQEIADLSQRKAEVDRRISELRELANSKLGSAATERAAAGDLELRASRLGATAALPLIEESHKRRRQADTLEREALSLDAQADQIAPVSAEYALDVSRLEAQRALLESEGQSAQERADRGRAEAAEARQAADAAAQRLDEAVDALAALRSGDIAEAYDEAVRLYESAAQTARRGSGAGRLQAGAVQGRALQELAALRRSRAARLNGAARLLGSLSALPNAGDYAALADEYASAADAELLAADEADGEARSAFESAGLIDQPEDDFDYPDAPAPSPAGADPWILIDAVVLAAGERDIETLPALVHAETPAAQQILDLAARGVGTYARLDRVAVNQFGQGMWDQALAQLESQREQGLLPEQQAEIIDQMLSFQLDRSAFNVRRDGDLAFISWADTPQVELRAGLVDGQWKFLVGDPELSRIPLDDPAAAIGVIGPYVTRMFQATDAVIDRIEAGEFTDWETVNAAIQLKTNPIVFEMMGDPEVQQIVQGFMERARQPDPSGGP